MSRLPETMLMTLTDVGIIRSEMAYEFSIRTNIASPLKQTVLTPAVLLLASVPVERAGIDHLHWPFVNQCNLLSVVRSHAC